MQAKGDWSAQGAEPEGEGIAVGDEAIRGRTKAHEGSAGWCSEGQAERREDLGHYGGIFDGGDDLLGRGWLASLARFAGA